MRPGRIIERFTTHLGEKGVIRAVAPRDVAAALDYVNALIAEDTFVAVSGPPLTEAHERRFIRVSVAEVRLDRKIHLVMELDGVLVGMGEVRPESYRKRHIGTIGISILAPYRDRGLGSRLLASLIAEAKRIGLRLLVLTVFENNPKATHIYEKAGFRVSGVTPGAIAFKGAFVGEVAMYLPLV